MPWYEYQQSNSGNRWTRPATVVYVEAASPDEADDRFFDGGISEGTEADFCECCGGRWCWADEDEWVGTTRADVDERIAVIRPQAQRSTFARELIPAAAVYPLAGGREVLP